MESLIRDVKMTSVEKIKPIAEEDLGHFEQAENNLDSSKGDLESISKRLFSRVEEE